MVLVRPAVAVVEMSPTEGEPGFRIVAAVCIAIFAFLFVTVSSRIVGLVGVTSNPTSGMAIVALFVFPRPARLE